MYKDSIIFTCGIELLAVYASISQIKAISNFHLLRLYKVFRKNIVLNTVTLNHKTSS